jgi:hypothetical protein
MSSGPFRLTLVIIPVDKHGRRGKPIVTPTNSWLQQMAQILNGMFRALDEPDVTDTSGADQTTEATGSGFVMHANAPVSNVTYGILVGTDDSAEDKDDNALGALIADGAGAGQLEYSATTIFSPPLGITGGYRIRIERQFDNASGSTITINEVGLALTHSDGGGTQRFFLVIRDVVSGGHPVEDAEGVVFQYRIDFLV